MSSSQLALLGGTPAVPPGTQRRWPDVTEADRAAVMAVLDRGAFTGAGTVDVAGLADDYAAWAGVEHCLVFNSGTATLHASTVAAGLRPGDEMLVPAFTYMASAMAPTHHGCVPVFCDVEPDTFNINPDELERRLTPRTRGIMVVHLHGLTADMDALGAFAERHGLAVIEDFSQAHGATHRGRKAGTLGSCGGGSLNATKNLSGGEGGLFVTNDPEAFAIARRLRYLGEDLPDPEPSGGRRYWSHGIGWNYRGQELPAAFARSQLRRLDAYNERADANATRLTAGLREVAGLLPPVVPDGHRSVWYLYRVRLDAATLGYDGDVVELRDRIVHALIAEGVPAFVWQHHPLPAHPVFRRTLAPWTPAGDQEELRPWSASEWPVAQRLCDESFVFNGVPHPLAVQDEATVDAYVEAAAKVFEHVEELLEAPFETPATTRAAAALALDEQAPRR
jgi:dTDP-4-amino-4,6-dideoxygalactose transaminase